MLDRAQLRPPREGTGCIQPCNRRILVVDDNTAIHSDFRKIFSGGLPPTRVLMQSEAAFFGGMEVVGQDTPFELDCVSQGQEALQRVIAARDAGQPYAMAFLDVRMPPGWDGIETAAKLWEQDEDLQIVLCTAYTDCSWRQMRAQLGRSDRFVILKKPFDNIEALQLADALTEKWRLTRQTRIRLSDLQVASDAQSALLATLHQEIRTPTSGVLSGVAAATSHRDRDELDRAFAALLLQFLDTHSITLLKLIEEGQVRRVERRLSVARQSENGRAGAHPLAIAPAPVDFPAWEQCVLQGEVIQCDAKNGRVTTGFPIRGEQGTAGILLIESAAPLSQREIDLVLGILGIVSNHLALLDYGELDTLTRLLNRKTFERQFEKLRQRLIGPQPGVVAQSRGGAEPSWLALVDIDHFKSINDGYGHLFGDEILLLVSQLMRHAFRGADQLFRFGGEEFVIMLEHASEPGAQVAFERLRATIEEYAFPQIGRVTISVGYTLISPTDVPALCVERADAALYYAKNHGRNNVRSCEALVAAGEINSRFKVGEVELF